MLDQIEERPLSPVNVLEDDDHGPPQGLLLEQLAERPGDLLRARPRFSLAEQRADRSGSRGGGGQHVELLHDLDDRPVRDSLPIGEAPATKDHRIDSSESLYSKARLADAGFGDDRDQLAALLPPNALPGVGESRKLVLTSDEQRAVPPFVRLADRQEPVSGDGVRLTLQFERLD